MTIRTHEEWERDTEASYEGLTLDGVRRDLDRLEAKRNWSHADYTRFDYLSNAAQFLRDRAAAQSAEGR
jgi:hypothetical protein